jgi:hypothetical protein
MYVEMRLGALLLAEVLLTAACRGGARGAAAQLPMPQEPGQWIVLGLFVFGIWWAAMKITRG